MYYYIYLEGYEQISGWWGLTELECYLDNKKTDYKVLDVYHDSYWNSTSYWGKIFLYDGIYTANGGTQCLPSYGNETNAMFAIQADNINLIKFYWGPGCYPCPTKIRIYQSDIYNKDWLDPNNINSNLIFLSESTKLYDNYIDTDKKQVVSDNMYLSTCIYYNKPYHCHHDKKHKIIFKNDVNIESVQLKNKNNEEVEFSNFMKLENNYYSFNTSIYDNQSISAIVTDINKKEYYFTFSFEREEPYRINSKRSFLVNELGYKNKNTKQNNNIRKMI